MADQRLLRMFKLGWIQLLSGTFPLAALARDSLPENRAHPASKQTAAPLAESPPSTEGRSSTERREIDTLPLRGAARPTRPASPSLLAAPRPSGGRYVTAPSPTPEPF